MITLFFRPFLVVYYTAKERVARNRAPLSIEAMNTSYAPLGGGEGEEGRRRKKEGKE